MRITYLLRLLTSLTALSLFMGSSLTLQAATYTVTADGDPDCSAASGNTGDLQACLDEANGDGEESTLDIEPGLYDASAGPFTYIAAEDFPLTLQATGTGAILDGGGASEVLAINTSGANSPIVIDGLTIQNGDGQPALEIASTDGTTTVSNCSFLNNVSDFSGGGLQIFNENAAITVSNNLFQDNAAEGSGGGASIGFYAGPLNVEYNTFEGNTAGNDGGGLEIGDADVDPASDITIFNNLIINNITGGNGAGSGGGVFIDAPDGNTSITNNIVAGNTATDEEGGGFDITQDLGSLVITNNTITQNNAGTNGGGVAIGLGDTGSTADLYNNIIWNNAIDAALGGFGADIFGNGDENGDTDAGLFNVFNNDFTDFYSVCRDDAAAACAPTPNTETGSNVDLDPIFVNAAADDFHLTSTEALTSPVVEIGDPTAPDMPSVDYDGVARPDRAGTNPDLGALEAVPFVPPPVDNSCVQGSGGSGNYDVNCQGCALNPNLLSQGFLKDYGVFLALALAGSLALSLRRRSLHS